MIGTVISSIWYERNISQNTQEIYISLHCVVQLWTEFVCLLADYGKLKLVMMTFIYPKIYRGSCNWFLDRLGKPHTTRYMIPNFLTILMFLNGLIAHRNMCVVNCYLSICPLKMVQPSIHVIPSLEFHIVSCKMILAVTSCNIYCIKACFVLSSPGVVWFFSITSHDHI